ncbi:MFS transporter [Oceanobacillus timonensis]|uniref:MFS transporter n=1 Tax=Oceanobacillus timonensis TaxID=1926285 RepID=UPI0009B9DB98|nr:MFS transporter [Oceanobacillus timonensis]
MFKNKNYWFSSGYLFLFFITWSIWWSFYSIWLSGTLGLTGSQTGTVFSINSFLSLIFMLLYGVIQDKIGTKKHLIWFQSIFLMGTGPFIIYIYEPLLQTNFTISAILGGVYFGAGFIAGVAFLESYAEKLSRKFNFEYGTSRMWGSIGYACATLTAGLLLSINPHLNFWIASVAGVGFFLLNCFFKTEVTKKEEEPEEEAPSLRIKDIISIVKVKKFWYFVLFLFGTACIYTIYDVQLFPIYFTEHFTDTDIGYQIFGYLNSFQVFLESAMLFAAPFIVNRIGAKQSLILAGVIMGTRIIGSALVDSTIAISFIKLLHGIELPILLIAIFKYISLNFDQRLSATIYLIGFKISGEIGVIAFSSIIGKLYDNTGFITTFFVLGTIVYIFTIASIFFLTNQNSKRNEVLPYDTTQNAL